MKLYLVLTWIFVTGALLPIVLFAWYLAWPVTSGVVTRVDEWMQPTNDVLRAKSDEALAMSMNGKVVNVPVLDKACFLPTVSPRKNKLEIRLMLACVRLCPR